jgi:hypothetical protein
MHKLTNYVDYEVILKNKSLKYQYFSKKINLKKKQETIVFKSVPLIVRNMTMKT